MGLRRRILSRISAAYFLLLVLCTAVAAAQEPSTPLALDPAIHTGKLPNGLTFFIRQNTQPEKRAAMRLVVKAGSIDEADDQRGLAHLLEHMAFNGSTHFKSGELVDYLESIGARFGPDVNAYTSFDETVYMLELPTDREEILGRGLDALSDFAGGIALETSEIDRERGVVIEEWRGRQGAATRMEAVQMRALFGESKYTERVPIGLPEVLKTFPAERLRDFYRDFYRTDRMAVVAVGDFDPARVEALIREHFESLPAASPATRSLYPVQPHSDTRYVAVSDPEAQASSVTVVQKRPLRSVGTASDYRQSLVRGLVYGMVNARFTEIARRTDAPFLRASAGESSLGRDVETFTVSARVNDGGIEKGLEAIGQELARLSQHGFAEAELERAKKDVIASYERAYNERDKQQTGGLASELVRHFLTDEPAPGIATELELVRRFIPTITTAEAVAVIKEAVRDDNRVVLAVSPSKESVPAVTEAGLRAALSAGAAATVEAWRDGTTGRELLAKPPTPGAIRARREIPEIGVTVLTLSNGVDVWLKPTDFRNDQVAFTAYSRGGTSLASEAEYLDASFGASLVGISGVGGFTPVDLDKVLAGRIANASAFISTYTHGISGGGTPRDLETALQLVYLYFTAPNRDAEAFTLLKRRLDANLANQAQSPGAAFGEEVSRLNTNDHYSVRPMRPADVPRLDAERMMTFYEARFRNAADFTFFFVGAFTVDQVAPLLTTYLASLPSTGKAEADLRNLDLRFPAMVERETVNKGQEPRSQTAITFFSDTGLDEIESHRLRAATTVLQMRLRDVLREELGGTYSVGVGYSDTAPQPGYGTTTVQFGSSPENAERLRNVVMSELEKLRSDGPSESEVGIVKETEKRELETALRQNGYWLNSLQAVHLLGRDPIRIPQRIERTESLSRENIHAAFRKYFPPDRHTVVTLMPESAGRPVAAR
ncbi:MAG TPA: insulinase family protein [Vicinamibacterales bacterium]